MKTLFLLDPSNISDETLLSKWLSSLLIDNAQYELHTDLAGTIYKSISLKEKTLAQECIINIAELLTLNIDAIADQRKHCLLVDDIDPEGYLVSAVGPDGLLMFAFRLVIKDSTGTDVIKQPLIMRSLGEDCTLEEVIVLCDNIAVGETILVHGYKFTKWIESELGVMMEGKDTNVFPVDVLPLIAGDFD